MRGPLGLIAMGSGVDDIHRQPIAEILGQALIAMVSLLFYPTASALDAIRTVAHGARVR